MPHEGGQQPQGSTQAYFPTAGGGPPLLEYPHFFQEILLQGSMEERRDVSSAALANTQEAPTMSCPSSSRTLGKQ